MRRQLLNLFDALSASYPLDFRESALEEDFPDLTPVLNNARLLKPGNPSHEVICPALPNNCLVTAHRANGRYYVHCECSQEVGLVEIDPKQLKQFRFDLSAFLTWLAKQAGVETDVREVETGQLWHLGEKTLRGETANVYFSRLTNRKKIETLRQSFQKREKPPIIFWLGETAHKGHNNQELISLPDTVRVSEQGFTFPRKRIETLFAKRPASIGGGLDLDKHLCVQGKSGKYRLLMLKERGSFQQEKIIRPQAYQLIQFLHQVRNYAKRTYSLKELAERFSSANKSSISDRMREINTICRNNGVKTIFHKHAKNEWGINPNLDCCR